MRGPQPHLCAEAVADRPRAVPVLSDGQFAHEILLVQNVYAVEYPSPVPEQWTGEAVPRPPVPKAQSAFEVDSRTKLVNLCQNAS